MIILHLWSGSSALLHEVTHLQVEALQLLVMGVGSQHLTQHLHEYGAMLRVSRRLESIDARVHGHHVFGCHLLQHQTVELGMWLLLFSAAGVGEEQFRFTLKGGAAGVRKVVPHVVQRHGFLVLVASSAVKLVVHPVAQDEHDQGVIVTQERILLVFLECLFGVCLAVVLVQVHLVTHACEKFLKVEAVPPGAITLVTGSGEVIIEDEHEAAGH